MTDLANAFNIESCVNTMGGGLADLVEVESCDASRTNRQAGRWIIIPAPTS